MVSGHSPLGTRTALHPALDNRHTLLWLTSRSHPPQSPKFYPGGRQQVLARIVPCQCSDEARDCPILIKRSSRAAYPRNLRDCTSYTGAGTHGVQNRNPRTLAPACRAPDAGSGHESQDGGCWLPDCTVTTNHQSGHLQGRLRGSVGRASDS